MARNITQNNEDAEDILQDSFLKAFTHLDTFQGQSKFYTWLVRIAVNESLMRLRKRKSDRTVSMDENIETDEEPIVREIAGGTTIRSCADSRASCAAFSTRPSPV